MKNFKFIIRLSAILFAITFICTLLLVLCNTLTENRIATLQAEAENNAKSEVLPGAVLFKQSKPDVFRGMDRNGKTIGYCFKAEPSGFGGPISLIVGINTQGEVTGVKVISMSETPGLGAKAGDASWIEQFKNKTADISVVKTGNAGENEINAISGATITSKAVTDGVNAALKEARNLLDKEVK